MADLLVHHWSHPTTPAGAGWDIVQSGVVRLTTEKGFSARAALGEAEVIRVIVDDDSGTADYKTLHRWYMVETATAGSQLVWNGYISDQYQGRTADGEILIPSGGGRIWELEITQENTLLGFRAITGDDGERDAESPGERLTWLLASDYLSTVVDHGLIDWTALNALPDMDPAKYIGQTAADVLRDISLKTTFNHYARYRDASSDIELAFYDANTSTLDSSTLKISNDPADLTGDPDTALIYPPSMDSRLQRKGDRVSAGVLVLGSGVKSYGYLLPTSYEFGFRDMVVSDANTTTQAGADRLRDKLLAQHDEQDERIRTRIHVSAANLNAVKHGQRIQAKFVHLSDWEDYRWARVIMKSFSRPGNETQARYDVDLELSPQTTIPNEQFNTSTQQGGCESFTWDLPPSEGSLLIGGLVQRAVTPYTSGIVPIGNTVPGSCSDLTDVVGTGWTYINGVETQSNPAANRPGYPITMAWREAVASEPQTIRWGGTGGLGGTARPRSHQMEIALTPAAPSVESFLGDIAVTGATFTSQDITVGAAGYIVFLMGYNCSGPNDGSSASFTMEATSDDTHILTQGFQYDGFGGYSVFGYRYVSAGGLYTDPIVLTRSAAPRAGTDYSFGLCFWAGAATPGFPA